MYWWTIILSALLYGSAFHYPVWLGWAVIPALYLVFAIMSRQSGAPGWKTIGVVAAQATVWGLCAYGIVHWWVYLVIKTHGSLSIVATVGMFILFVSILATSVVVWWVGLLLLMRCTSSTVGRWSVFITSTVGYYFLFDRYGGVIGGQLVGYPLLSPLLPLASYKPFLHAVALVSSCFGPGHHYYASAQKDPFACTHLKPALNKRNEREVEHLRDRGTHAQVIYHQLKELASNQLAVFVSPESSFPHCLDQCEELCALWGQALSHNQDLLLGARYRGKQGGASTQAVFYIVKHRISDFYVKKHLVPFGECPHPLFNSNKEKQFFNSQSEEWMKIDDTAGSSTLHVQGWEVIPRICSEFLVLHGIEDYLPYRYDTTKKYCVIFFVNDSWFDAYFVHLLHLYTALRAAWIGLPVAYVGHDEVVWF